MKDEAKDTARRPEMFNQAFFPAFHLYLPLSSFRLHLSSLRIDVTFINSVRFLSQAITISNSGESVHIYVGNCYRVNPE